MKGLFGFKPCIAAAAAAAAGFMGPELLDTGGGGGEGRIIEFGCGI